MAAGGAHDWDGDADGDGRQDDADGPDGICGECHGSDSDPAEMTAAQLRGLDRDVRVGDVNGRVFSPYARPPCTTRVEPALAARRTTEVDRGSTAGSPRHRAGPMRPTAHDDIGNREGRTVIGDNERDIPDDAGERTLRELVNERIRRRRNFHTTPLLTSSPACRSYWFSAITEYNSPAAGQPRCGRGACITTGIHGSSIR